MRDHPAWTLFGAGIPRAQNIDNGHQSGVPAMVYIDVTYSVSRGCPPMRLIVSRFDPPRTFGNL